MAGGASFLKHWLETKPAKRQRWRVLYFWAPQRQRGEAAAVAVRNSPWNQRSIMRFS
jgi:hypothetical protein